MSLIDITGQTFNAWTVLGLAPKRTNRPERYWYCRCECGIIKVLSSYSVRKAGTKSCGCKKNSLIAQANTRHGLAKRYTKWSPEYKLFQYAKVRAKKYNLTFSLNLEDIVIPAKCPVLGLSLCTTHTKVQANSPTLDRFDNTQGYTKENIRVISYRANTLKSDATVEELEQILVYIRS
jgi:hypothetical protein